MAHTTRMSDVVFRLSIQGRVQGVYYRQSIAEEAARLGVTGWVRNRLDGSVEAVVAGQSEAVQAIVSWSHQGPENAVVTAVHMEPHHGHFTTFERLPTA